MNRQQRRKLDRKQRHFRVEAVPRQSPDLHKLAQVFLGMAVARAEQTGRHDGGATPNGRRSPEPEDDREVE